MADLLLALILVVLQAAAGAYLWQLTRRGRAGLLECLGAGLALGTALSALSGVLLWPWLPVWGWAAPSLLAWLAAFVLRLRTGSVLGRSRAEAGARWLRIDRPSLVALLVSLVLGLAALASNLRSYPLSWSGVQSGYHPDMLFFEALSTSIAHDGPGDSIFMAGAQIRYHWLSYAWSGQLAQVVDAQPFLVLTRVLPLTALIGAVLIAVAWARRLTAFRWAPTIAAVLIVSGGYVGATYGTILNFDSPSQQLATVWVLGLCLALWQIAQSPQAARTAPLLAVILVLAAASTLGKVSTGLVVLAAWGLLTIVGALRREAWAARACAALAATAIGSGAVYLAWISGSAEGGGLGLGSLLNKASSVQGLNPSDARWGIALGTGLLLLAMAARWAGLVWLVGARSTRWDPLTVFGAALVLVSVASVLLISGGLNDTWFALAASAPLSVISAVGLAHGLESIAPRMRWRPTSAVSAAVVAGLLVSLLIGAIWSLGPGHSPFLRWAGPLTGFVAAFLLAWLIAAIWPVEARRRRPRLVLVLALVMLTVMAASSRLLGVASSSFGVQAEGGINSSEFRPITPFLVAKDLVTVDSWSDAERAAGRWLAEHADAQDVIATNVTYSPLVPALAARRTLISGIQYQAPYGRPSALQQVMDRETMSIDFVNNPGDFTATNLCNSDVDWVWVDPRRTPTRDWEPYAHIVFTSADAIILRLDPSDC